MKQYFFLLLVIQIVTQTVNATNWNGSVVSLYPTNAVADGDEFGFSVSVSGDKMAVGARGDDEIDNFAGAVYTYTWSGSMWVADSTPVLYPTNAATNSDSFGKSVSMSGDKMAVGSTGDDEAGSSAGAVYTYTWNGTAWVADSTPVLYPTNAVAVGDEFGSVISMSGDKMAVGSTGDDDTGSDAGAVYTYTWNSTAWVADSTPVLYPTNAVADSDSFGKSVSMSGDKMAVGSINDDTNGSNAGAVYTYTWNSTAWVADSTPVLYPTNAVADSDQFGWAVSMSGDKMAVGSFGDDYTASSAGAVYTYTWDSTAWVKDAVILYPTNAVADVDQFGKAVSMSGDKMAVGSALDDGTGSNAGAVYTYTWNSTTWVADSTPVLYPTNAATDSDLFGEALSMDGLFLAVGARSDDDTGTGAGAVYTFSIPTEAPTLSPIGAPTGSPTSSPSDSPTSSPTGSPTTAVPTVSPTIDTGTPLTVSTITYFVRDDEDRASVIEDLIAALAISFPDTSDYSVKKNIVSVETGIITQELITETNNNTLLEEKIKAIRCGNAVDSCTITINYGGGRRLTERELAAGIYIEITYEISSELLATVDGLDLDDPAFEQQLADALGISNLTNIEITSDGGEITISATLEALPNSDPLGTELLATAQALYTDMVDVTTALLIALGASDSELLSSNINLCAPDRDCSGNGSCNSYTGVCACVGNWWGINCETPCECFNGGECVKAFCHCKFPFFGLRCNNDSGCSTCNAPTPPPTPGGTSIPEAP
jgi:hypothetical protein